MVQQDNTPTAIEEALHEAEIDHLEHRIMELALELAGAQHGALFLWDEKRDGLTLDFHMVDDVAVPLPEVLLTRRGPDQPSGIALWVLEHGETYVCQDCAADPNYARYFLDVGSMVSVAIHYQRRTIGVLSVSDRKPNGFRDERMSC